MPFKKYISVILVIAFLLPSLAHAQELPELPENQQDIVQPAPRYISFFERILRIFLGPRQRSQSVETPVFPPAPQQGEFISLGSLRTESPYAKAFGVNAKRQIVGMSMTDTKTAAQAFLWENGTMHELPGLHANSHAVAQAINNSGVIAGFAGDGKNLIPAQGGDAPDRAVQWRNGKIERLPLPAGYIESRAYDINDRGDITGDISNTTETQAVIWEAGKTPRVLGTLGGTQSVGLRILSDGRVLGNYRTAQGVLQNFIFDNNQMRDYTGYLLPNPAEQWAHTFGRFSFEGGLFDANGYLPENSPWQIMNIERVYPNGDLVGFGTHRKNGGTVAIFLNNPNLSQSSNP